MKIFIPPSHSHSAYVYNGCLTWYNIVLTPRIHSTVNSQLEQNDVSKQPTRTLYKWKKIAVTTNKEYNGILIYTPTDCFPRLNESGVNNTLYYTTHPLHT